MTEQRRHEFFIYANTLADMTDLLHHYLIRVYIALGTLCQRRETFRDTHGEWQVWTGKHTVREIAKKAGVRSPSVSKATEIWHNLGPIPKRVISITDKERIKYVLLPRNHPAFVGLREKGEAMRSRLGKNWGLLPKKKEGFPISPSVARVPDSRQTPGVCLEARP